MTTPWTLVESLSPGGHHVFTHADGGVVIADRSGGYPDECDDGPNWLPPYDRDYPPVVMREGTVVAELIGGDVVPLSGQDAHRLEELWPQIARMADRGST